MIVSWQLLNRFVDLPVSPEEAAARLTMSGAEVESIERPGESISGVVAARVQSLGRHPSRENLFVAEVDTGKGKAVCVTAATNLKAGDRVFYGAPGAVLPAGAGPDRAGPSGKMELGVRDFGEVRSEGMMLSAEELGLPGVDIEEGILVLPGDAPIGADARALCGIGDVLLDVSVTPNRGDLLSILGMARELKGLYPDAVLKPMPWEKSAPGTGDWPVPFGAISLPDDGCLNYHLGLATNVRIGPSPVEIRVALSRLGMRPISNVVDATNYVMLLLGQPLHAFDLNTLPEREITVRRAFEGETIVTLDGKERVLTSKDMLITSGREAPGGRPTEPIALAGIMGGKQTGINDDTDIVVLEGASFSPRRVGHTSRRLSIASEAAFRYSRGVDPALSALGVDYALSLMAEWSGAEIGCRKLSAYNVQPEPQPVVLTKKKLQTYLLWSDMEESTRILEGYAVRRVKEKEAGKTGKGGEDARVFLPPTWRPDIAIEEDLIEEIGRYRGYDAAPVRMPGVLPRRGDIGPETSLAGSLRACAIARGYVEAITYSFLPESFVSALRLPGSDPRAHPLSLENPISQEWTAMRTTLVPGLLNGLRESVASGWRGPVRLFEIGRVFLRGPAGPSEPAGQSGPEGHGEPDVMAGLVCGGTDPRSPWPETRDDFLSVKADVEAFLRARGVGAVFARGAEPFGHRGQTADILSERKKHEKNEKNEKSGKIGYLARLSPAIERELGFTEPVYVFELYLTALESPDRPVYAAAPPFPAAFRDISMLVPNAVTQAEVLAEIQALVSERFASDSAVGGFSDSAAGGFLESVKLFDLYSGKGIPAGYRSMAFSLSYRASGRTLNDEEVDRIHNAVRDTLTQRGYNMR
ncbi:MAG: phenylalanine--tRNA ligase subunit beta [Synergistaceae bacterium]|jgi:phenylalanyl-tRNA synthetase beta chain|nr:phenylalanine--tRNA ligase subunit beta [Synergistaceae bacterium]